MINKTILGVDQVLALILSSIPTSLSTRTVGVHTFISHSRHTRSLSDWYWIRILHAQVDDIKWKVERGKWNIKSESSGSGNKIQRTIKSTSPVHVLPGKNRNPKWEHVKGKTCFPSHKTTSTGLTCISASVKRWHHLGGCLLPACPMIKDRWENSVKRDFLKFFLHLMRLKMRLAEELKFTWVVSKPQNPIIFIISTSSSVLPSKSASVEENEANSFIYLFSSSILPKNGGRQKWGKIKV